MDLLSRIFIKITAILTTIVVGTSSVSTSSQPNTNSEKIYPTQLNETIELKENKALNKLDALCEPQFKERVLIKEIPKEVIRDLSPEKISSYEKIIGSLQSEIQKLKTENEAIKTLQSPNTSQANTLYNEIREVANSKGWFIRLYPKNLTLLQNIVVLASDGVSPVSNLKVKVIGYDRNDVADYSGDIQTDKNGLIEKLNFSIRYDVLGNPVRYYKFFRLNTNNNQEMLTELFRFPAQ